MMLLHWLKGIDKLGHTSTTLNFRCLMKNLVGFEVSFKTKMVQLIGIVAFQTEEKYLTAHTHTHTHTHTFLKHCLPYGKNCSRLVFFKKAKYIFCS
jgi:hypothetical protein